MLLQQISDMDVFNMYLDEPLSLKEPYKITIAGRI
jgi:hypothetical protein